jgi:hypothetical protein
VTGVNKLGKTTQTVNLLKAPKKMTEIMRVKIHSPSIKEFDPLSAVHLWNSSSTRGRTRRVNQQPYGERELEEEELSKVFRDGVRI